MLRPTKHSHPDRTVINATLVLISFLKTKRIACYDDMKSYLKKKIQGGDNLYLPALNFLYLLGLIEYRDKTDSFEYIERK